MRSRRARGLGQPPRRCPSRGSKRARDRRRMALKVGGRWRHCGEANAVDLRHSECPRVRSAQALHPTLRRGASGGGRPLSCGPVWSDLPQRALQGAQKRPRSSCPSSAHPARASARVGARAEHHGVEQRARPRWAGCKAPSAPCQSGAWCRKQRRPLSTTFTWSEVKKALSTQSLHAVLGESKTEKYA